MVGSCFRGLRVLGHSAEKTDSKAWPTGTLAIVFGMTGGRKLDQINPQKSALGFEARGSNSAHSVEGVPSPIQPKWCLW